MQPFVLVGLNKISLLCLLYALLASSSYGQDAKLHREIDSLQNLTYASNSLKNVQVLQLIASKYYFLEYKDSSLKYGGLAFQAAEKYNYETELAEASLMLGRIHLSIAGVRDKTIGYLLRSLQLYTKLKDDDGISQCNLQLGVLSFELQNYNDAVAYLRESAKHGTSRPASLGVIQYLMAICYSEIGDFKQATELFDKAKKAYGTNHNNLVQIETFEAKMYANQGNYKEALLRFNLIIEKYKNKVAPDMMAPTYAFISAASLKDGNYYKSIKYGKKAYTIFTKITSSEIYLRYSLESLSSSYEKIGKTDSALFYLKTLSGIKDSISNNAVLQRMAELKGKFDFEQQMHEQKAAQALKDAVATKELENARRMRNIFIVGFALVMMFAGLFFYQRNKIGKEKKRSDELLLNILPEETANELKATGESAAKLCNMVTVMFTDFIDFTQISEKMSPTELVHEIHSYFSVFDKIMDQFGLEKIKTIGDAYMATGGLHGLGNESVKNTILAAIEMQNYLTTKHNASDSELNFQMRIGLHTGPVVAGIVGVKKFQYDIWGDTVNTASRMETMGASGRVNISQTTYEIVKDDPDFVFESRGKLTAKGKGEIGMWFVVLCSEAHI